MPVCEGCGGSYAGNFSFCPYCGRAKPEPDVSKLEVEITSKSTIYDCPLCEDASSTQKVSAIVAGGTTKSQSSGYTSGTSDTYSANSGSKIATGSSSAYSQQSGQSQSVLAKKFVPANSPREPEREDFAIGLGGFSVILLVVFWWITSGILGLFLGSYLLRVFIAFFVATFGVAKIENFMNKDNGTDEKLAAANKVYKEDLTAYAKVVAMWEQLFYCHRHDLVFVPGKQEVASVDEAWPATARWALDGDTKPVQVAA
jgi:hypothetical protein